VEASAALGDFTKAVQDSDKMPHNLGTLLLRYVKLVPGGMLVFLPKYSLINRVMEEWGRSGILRQLEVGLYKLNSVYP
jgi:Rad3-related DNA helicase